MAGLRSYLDLTGTEITDAGLFHLKGLNYLICLDSRYTKVTDEGANKLQEALPKCWIGH